MARSRLRRSATSVSCSIPAGGDPSITPMIPCPRFVTAKGRRGYFTGFSPAISGKAKKAKGKQIRDWHLNRRSSADLTRLLSGEDSRMHSDAIRDRIS